VVLQHAATLLASCGALILAWRSGRRNQTAWALFWILACGFVLRLDFLLYWNLWQWDERYHALLAKNFLTDGLTPRLYSDAVLPERHGGWTTAAVWLHKPPLALWLLALGLRIFGVNAIALRIPSLVLSLIGVWLTYRVGWYIFGPRAALCAAAFHATNGVILDLAAGRRAVDHVDTLLIVLVAAGALVLVRGGSWMRRLFALVPLTAAALLTKMFPGYLIPALAGIALLGEGDSWTRTAVRTTTLVAAATAVALPWFLFTEVRWPEEFASSLGDALRHLPDVVESHGGGPGLQLARIGRFFGEGAWLAIALLGMDAARSKDGRLILLAAWIAIPYAVFSLAGTKMANYPLLAAPAIFLAEGALAVRLADSIREQRGRWLAAVLLAALVILPVRYTIERLNPIVSANGVWTLKHAERRPAWVDELRCFDRRLKDAGLVHSVIFSAPRPIETMFETSAIAYLDPPRTADVVRVEEKGYTPLVYRNGRLVSLGSIAPITLDCSRPASGGP
jgi:4-amino-4-deoxy-L-arabinose transferase-like glycosyltransferase